MAYTTISDLPELLPNDVQGTEYLLITNSNNDSNKLKINSISDYIASNLNDVVDTKVQDINLNLTNLNTKIENVSASNQITVLDEGLEVGAAKKINFIGATVNSFIDSDNGVIDVYIPSASFSSNFNTNNNNTDARLNTTSVVSRYISEPVNSNFYLGSYQAGSMYNCIKNTILNYSTPDKFYVESASKIRIEIIQDTIVDELEFDIINGEYASDKIFSTISNKQKELSHFTANFSCSLVLSSFSGYVKINIKYLGSSNYEFSEEFFIDNSTDIADIEIIPEIINNTYNYLSGIKYLGSGTQIRNNINLINSKSFSYPSILLDIDGSLAGMSTYSFNVSDLNITDYKYNSNINIIKTYNILSNKFYNGTLTIKGRINDWVVGTYKSFNLNALVNTYTDSSTRIYESFVSETNRLKQNLNVFNSMNILDTDELQVYNSKLVYPQLDFSEYYGNPDYSVLDGDKTYIRKFWHSGVSHSNGLFQITSNIIESDLSSGNVKIEISLDGIDWYDCSKDYTGGILVNNSGCRINSDTNSLNINNKMEFTLGLNKFTSLSSNWGIYCKITIAENAKSKYIDILQITNWN